MLEDITYEFEATKKAWF